MTQGFDPGDRKFFELGVHCPDLLNIHVRVSTEVVAPRHLPRQSAQKLVNLTLRIWHAGVRGVKANFFPVPPIKSDVLPLTLAKPEESFSDVLAYKSPGPPPPFTRVASVQLSH